MNIEFTKLPQNAVLHLILPPEQWDHTAKYLKESLLGIRLIFTPGPMQFILPPEPEAAAADTATEERKKDTFQQVAGITREELANSFANLKGAFCGAQTDIQVEAPKPTHSLGRGPLEIHISGKAGAGKSMLQSWLFQQLVAMGHTITLSDEDGDEHVMVGPRYWQANPDIPKEIHIHTASAIQPETAQVTAAEEPKQPLPPLHEGLIFPRDRSLIAHISKMYANSVHYLNRLPILADGATKLQELRQVARQFGRTDVELMESIIAWSRVNEIPRDQVIEKVIESMIASHVAEASSTESLTTGH